MAAIPEVVQLHEGFVISLDGDISLHSDEKIVIVRPVQTKEDSGEVGKAAVYLIKDIIHQSITGYGISGKATRITLNDEEGGGISTWIDPKNANFSIIRKTIVYCQPEELELAGEPIDTDITEKDIEVEGVWKQLENNRQVVISGINKKDGSVFSKKAILNIVNVNEEENYPFSTVNLVIDDNEDEFCLKRDTVKIYGNVVAASQGETRREVLGSGDGRKESQTFVLKQASKDAHLTYVSAATATGSSSTLKVFVNDIRWHETDILSNCTSIDQNFITKIDEEGGVSVIFGNGKKGARLPTGIENVRAEYRTGSGDAGNVKLGQISLLVDRSLGVKEVINPVAASSGSDKDKLNQARKNALRAIRALDRLISVQDYEDFAATYAGIGKAKAVELSNGQRQVVHVTIAGTSSHPDKQLTDSSDLVKNLKKSLDKCGDPQQEVQLAICELIHIVLKANVCISPDYNWEKVEAELRSKLLDAFSFERLELGQDVLLGEVYSIMQAVPGVDYVDVDAFGGIPERIKGDKVGDGRRFLTSEEISYAVEYFSKQWKKSSIVGEQRLLTFDEIAEAIWCKSQPQESNCTKYHEQNFEKILTISQRIAVNLAAFENSLIRPAQLAFLSPDLPETLVLKQIK